MLLESNAAVSYLITAARAVMQLNVLFAQVTILIFRHETNALQVFLSASVRSSC